MPARKRILPPPPKPAKPRRRRGGQPANTNALKHGGFTRELRVLYADISAHVRTSRALVQAFRAATRASPEPSARQH